MTSRPEILIVGGGVAGLSLATQLGKSLGKRGKARITLIDKSFSHVWKPMLHCFAAGTVLNENDRVSFITQASRCHFEFWPGEVVSVDRCKKEVVLSPFYASDGTLVLDSRTLRYDAMVLAIGSCANDFGTPGVKEHCLPIDNLVDANNFNEKFRMELLKAFANTSELDIAIVGGGATGTQLAAELHKALDIVDPYSLHAFGRTPPSCMSRSCSPGRAFYLPFLNQFPKRPKMNWSGLASLSEPVPVLPARMRTVSFSRMAHMFRPNFVSGLLA